MLSKHAGLCGFESVVLCIEVLRLKRAIINIVVAGDLATIVSVEFYNLGEIVVDCVKFKILFPTPFDSF